MAHKRLDEGIDVILTANPWPDLRELEGQPPYLWSLDGGGRELITGLIRGINATTMLEIGSFLGGSAISWLESDPTLILIVADPWDWDCASWLRVIIASPPEWIQDKGLLERLVPPIEKHGMFKIALHNLRKYRDRLIPLKMRAEQAYRYVSVFGEPDIIYIDANKERQDYVLAHEIFPNSIISGDDWEWTNDKGIMVVRDYVSEVAKLRGCRVVARRATWILEPTRGSHHREPSR
jgi:hypothetical protein